MGNVQMEADQIRFKNASYGNVQTALTAALTGGGGDLSERVTALETTVGDESGGLVKDVDDLETTVGDSSSGLVKDVSELDPNNYSSTGVKVGKFLGSDLYRKVVDTGALPNNTTKRVSSGLTNETVRFMYGAATHTTSGDVIPLPRTTATQITSQCTLRYYAETNEIGMSTGSDLSEFGSSYVVLEYTNPAPAENNTRK